MTTLIAALGVFAVLRLLELAISKRNWQLQRSSAKQLPEARFRWMVALHTSVFILLPLEYYFFAGSFTGLLSQTALTVLALALLLRCWMFYCMGHSWNVRVVYGPNCAIVSNGPYHYIRHPNYVVVCLELLSLPLVWQLWRSALLLTLSNALVLRHRIAAEEAVLTQNPEWMMHMAHKPRFLPFLRG